MILNIVFSIYYIKELKIFNFNFNINIMLIFLIIKYLFINIL
jgi:hypothetical protein